MTFSIDSGKARKASTTTNNTNNNNNNNNNNTNFIGKTISRDTIKKENLVFKLKLLYEAGPIDQRTTPLQSLDISNDTSIEFIKSWSALSPNQQVGIKNDGNNSDTDSDTSSNTSSNSSDTGSNPSEINTLGDIKNSITKLGLWDSSMKTQYLVLIGNSMITLTKKKLSNGHFYYSDIKNDSIFQTTKSAIKINNQNNNNNINFKVNDDFIYQTTELVIDEYGNYYAYLKFFNKESNTDLPLQLSKPNDKKIYVYSLNFNDWTIFNSTTNDDFALPEEIINYTAYVDIPIYQVPCYLPDITVDVVD